jgi:hypothetical protein
MTHCRYPELFCEDFSSGIGHWTTPDSIGGPREVVNGVFRSWDWSYDTNHLTTHGGPGMLHLMAYADHHYWNYTNPDGSLVTSDFTNADVRLRIRGTNFNPNGSKFICWITAWHPYVPGKNVNWGFVAEPRTAELASGSWQDIRWRLDPDPSGWVWGKGVNGGIYDTFLSLQESLQNICNIHFPMLGPDNVGHPAGLFELDHGQIIFNRNGPGLSGPRWGDKASQVTLSNGDLTATHGVFGANGGVRGNTPITGKRYWEGKHLSGDITKCFSFGVCNSNYLPSVHGGTFYADTPNAWGFMCDRGAKRHNGVDVSLGSAFSTGDTYMVAVDGANVWFGKNGTWFNGGDPETGANPSYSGLTGEIYPIESNGTANASWVWRANFSGPFAFTPPAGFEGT